MVNKCWLHKVPHPSSKGTVVNNHDTLFVPGRLWSQRRVNKGPLASTLQVLLQVTGSMLSLHGSPAGGILGHLGPVWTVTSLCHWPFSTVCALCFENSEGRQELSSLIHTSWEGDLKGKRHLTAKNCSLIPERIMSFIFLMKEWNGNKNLILGWISRNLVIVLKQQWNCRSYPRVYKALMKGVR